MKYGLDDRPGFGALLLYGLQWWIVSLPCVVITGLVVARLHYQEIGPQIFYLQKLFGLTGLFILIQIFWGHRLPLVTGPATVLLVGLTAALSSGVPALYTALGLGGALMALAAVSGLLTRLRVFFTPRIVAVILLLIAITLTPVILRLIVAGGGRPSSHLTFALAFALALTLLNHWLPGLWKSLTLLIGLAGGTLAYALMDGVPQAAVQAEAAAGLSFFIERLDFQPGVILSFIFCFLALVINDVGSMESVGQMLKAADMPGRLRRGASVSGLGNLVSGAVGVIGSVNFTLGLGLIAATGCASRRTFIPAGLGLLACALFPQAVSLLSALPNVVMGSLLLYLMSSQFASGLSLLAVSSYQSGLTVGLPLMVGLLISFTPEAVLAGFPDLFRPIVANGFIMGTLTVMLLEHVVFKERK